MGKHVGRLNRSWLLVLGLLLLVAGLLTLLQAGGLLAGLSGMALPEAGSRVISDAAWSAADRPEATVVLGTAGLVAALLGLLWLYAQFARPGRAAPFRLHGGNADGFTLCDTAVLAAALDASIESLPGVLSSTSELRGTADAPDVTMRLVVSDRADLPALIHQIRSSALADLSTALETTALSWRLQADVGAPSQRSGTAVTASGVVLR